MVSDENFALSLMVRGADDALFFHKLDQPRGPVVTDLQAALDVARRGALVACDDGDGLVVEIVARPRAAVEGMLSGLGAGLDALRALDVPLRRAVLIGGGAQSDAVREIAPAVFGMPVEVPSPGEYVALGAARQAASVLD